MKCVTEPLRTFDDAWEHKWESLSAALEGVGEDEASWQPPCYRDEPVEEGWPKPGTIWWQVAHIAHCKRYYTLFVRAPGVEERPEAAPYRPVASFAEEVEGLKTAHAEQRAAIAALEDRHLPMRVGNAMTMSEFLAMATRHDTWHASQIALVRRLWKHR